MVDCFADVRYNDDIQERGSIMQQVGKLIYKPGTKEELLPAYDKDFPCISTRYTIPKGNAAPWHWHPTLELFYIEKGSIEYITPTRSRLFSTGSGGLLMPDVPHMTRGCQGDPGDTQLLHLFDPVLISGSPGSRIEKKYVLPLIEGTELLVLEPGRAEHREILTLLRESFCLSGEEPGYELKLRALLSRIWLKLCALTAEQEPPGMQIRTSEMIRQMLIHIHGHFSGKLTVADLAEVVCISERLCYKLFQKHLHMTSMEYINSVRVQTACRMLAQSETPVTDIAAACGFHSGSYFSRIFQQTTGQTPRDYRKASRQEK